MTIQQQITTIILAVVLGAILGELAPVRPKPAEAETFVQTSNATNALCQCPCVCLKGDVREGHGRR